MQIYHKFASKVANTALPLMKVGPTGIAVTFIELSLDRQHVNEHYCDIFILMVAFVFWSVKIGC